MYKKGDLKIGIARGSRLDQESEWAGGPVYHFPHSCDEWIIGKIEELKLLRKDIDEMAEEFLRSDKWKKNQHDYKK